nr:soluble scavenger receptor cysteine-rich domain-containing protein SSC5D-like [Anolis sagrei ordinatus]
MDQVNCTGKEEVLKKCPQENILNLTCDHRKGAGVECAGKTDAVGLFGGNCAGTETSLRECKEKLWIDDPYWSPNVVGAKCTEVRLANGSSDCSGRVEVFHNERWGTVCDAGWDLQDAQVVCGELGCGKAFTASGGAHFGRGTGPIWLGRLNCTGKEKSLRQCPKGQWEEHSCDHSADAGVECAEIRLSGSHESCAGRVEILHMGQWMTVRDNDWDIEDARVVCRYLGCGTALSTSHYFLSGENTASIWLDSFNCTGTELSLRECKAKEWQDDPQEKYFSYGVAGVVCTGSFHHTLSTHLFVCFISTNSSLNQEDGLVR